MDVREYVNSTDHHTCQRVLAELLANYMNPAFGALPGKEVDLFVLNALGELGYITAQPLLYELVSKLCVTRPKARNLIYDQELRRMDFTALDRG